MSHVRRMTALEASFLNLERPGIPMHVAGLSILESQQAVSPAELRAVVARRLRRLPGFREIPRGVRFGLGRPEWVRVGRIDLAAHLFHHRLRAPGRRSQLFALAGRIQEAMLPRDRPLWEMHLIDGLDDGRQALLVKTHHSITDGLAGVELAQVIFDRPDTTSHRIELKKTHFAESAASLPMAVLQSVLGAAFTAAGGPIANGGPFNGPVGAHRAFAAVRLPMDSIMRAKRELGGSVDDVVLAVVASGVGRYLHDVRYPDPPSTLRAMLPVSTRIGSRKPRLGNHVTSVFVDLPLDTKDAGALISRIAAQKSVLRSAHAADGGSLAIELAGMLPNPLHAALLQVVSSMPFANLVVSDIPGPAEPLQLLGRQINECYPLMPLPPSIGLAVATLSVGPSMGVGVTVDPDLVPNPQHLARSIESALATFRRARPALRQVRPPARARQAA